MQQKNTPAVWQLVLAFGAIYIIWGSTYLAMKYAIETMPPFLMAGIRFLIAGGILYAWSYFKGVPKPTFNHWKSATIIGGFLLLGANGGVAWAEKFVDSGMAALIITSEPLMIVLIMWIYKKQKPSTISLIGVFVGIIGMFLLIGPVEIANAQHLHPVGLSVIILAALSWSIGSVYSSEADLPSHPIQNTAMQMLAGGALLFIFSLTFEDLKHFEFTAISFESGLAFFYLIIFGSIIAFSAFSWLMRVESPSKVSTFAYVNPVIALFLGWSFRGEVFSSQSLFAAALLISAVFMITVGKKAQGKVKLRAFFRKFRFVNR
ncbi:MAG: EamA family transporter [Flammeovirgaceae bacterium]|nr:EamA family transporter [Flammeovirgaceae bacterium]